MKQTHTGIGEAESKHHTLGAFESRPSQAVRVTESRHNKDVKPRISALAGLESIRSKNGAFSSMDLMQRSRNIVPWLAQANLGAQGICPCQSGHQA
jgi:hypothetical protein